MAPNTATLRARLLDRIRSSTHTLTVYYPPLRAGAPLITAGVGPLNPLKIAPAGSTLKPVATTPSAASHTMPCLWLDAPALGNAMHTERRMSAVGWEMGAEAMARVALSDAVRGGTSDSIFAGADYVEHSGKRYTVLNVTPGGASFEEPFTYYVWLKGAERQ